ncbi:MAG: PAS domain S-box protein [Spirulina sp.]
MGMSSHIEKVYQRALALRQQAQELSMQPDLLDDALQQLYFVLEELQAADEEIQQQNQALMVAQQTLEIERQRYVTLFELAPDAYLVTDCHGLIYYANQAAAMLYGMSQDYLAQKPLIVFIAEGDRPHFQTRLATPGMVQDWETTLLRRDQAAVTVSISVAVLQNSLGEAHTLLWLLRDITPRKQMEQQLQAAHDNLEQQVTIRTAELTVANAQLQQTLDDYHRAEAQIRYQAELIDHVPDAIYVHDGQGRVEFWGPGAERLYAWSQAEALGQVIDDLFQEDWETLRLRGSPSQPEPNFWQGELNQTTQAGQSITVLSRRTQIYTDPGQPPSLLVVNTNITPLKQLEAQMYRAQRIESLGILASGVAHDLNNALTPVITAADILLLPTQVLPEPARELARLIKSGGKRSVDLIQQLLLFAQGTPHQQRPLWLRQPLLEVAELLRPALPNSVDLVLHIPLDWPSRVLANLTQLQQVFMNLCLNACDAMPQGGTLTLSVTDRWIDATLAQAHLGARPGHYGVVTVGDTGTGIEPSLMDQVFDPFFTTKPPGQGTGLGLSTVFSLVKQHGGFLEVESKVGLGTTFWVYLPILGTLASDADLPPETSTTADSQADCAPSNTGTPYDTEQP